MHMKAQDNDSRRIISERTVWYVLDEVVAKVRTGEVDEPTFRHVLGKDNGLRPEVFAHF